MYCADNFKKSYNFRQNCRFSEICRRNTAASTETFTEKLLGHNSALHLTFYLSIALSKILLHPKTIKSAKKLSVFCEYDSRRLFDFLQTHIFWKFHHFSRTYNQINCKNIWFENETMILMMIAEVLFFDIFFEKDSHLNAVERAWKKITQKSGLSFKASSLRKGEFPNCFISFPSDKHIFITIGICFFFIWWIFT